MEWRIYKLTLYSDWKQRRLEDRKGKDDLDKWGQRYDQRKKELSLWAVKNSLTIKSSSIAKAERTFSNKSAIKWQILDRWKKQYHCLEYVG